MSANAADAVVRPAASGASMRTMATRGKAHVGGTVRPGRSAKAPSAKTIITSASPRQPPRRGLIRDDFAL